LKLFRVLGVVGLFFFAAGILHADSLGDSRIVMGGGTDPSDPSCTAFHSSADSTGAIVSGDCTVAAGPAATAVVFATPAADVLGGALTCSSNLTNIGWNPSGAPVSGLPGWYQASTATIGGVAVDECSFTAPSSVSDTTKYYLKHTIHDPYKGYNDGDCDLDDFVLGIPAGCDITFSTPSGATGEDGNEELFAENAVFDVSGTGTGGLLPFPEPGTLALTLLGLVTLPFLRRKVTQ